jgi:hypothetical protein
MDGATGGLRNLNGDELHNLHVLRNIVKSFYIVKDEIIKACRTHGREENYAHSIDRKV